MISSDAIVAMVAGILAVGAVLSAWHWRKDKKEKP